MGKIEIDSECFTSLAIDIKENILSKTNFPKLIIGTGLSISYGLPGMGSLMEEIDKKIKKEGTVKCNEIWNEHRSKIEEFGLEAGLEDLNPADGDIRQFVNSIKKITAHYILTEEMNLINTIINNESGFKKLLHYLIKSLSINDPILDIMTPNYDRIIEYIADSLECSIINGFWGDTTQCFNENLLRNPKHYFNKNITHLRIFKPHGSVNWIKESRKIIGTNDNRRLFNSIEDIQIVTPGASKYEAGLTNDVFRSVRERFNEILSSSSNYSFLIYGYGFNDEHFNSVIMGKIETTKTLIISRTLKQEIVDLALANRNITAIFSINDQNKIIHKCVEYIISENLWDMNVFSSLILA